MRDFLKYTIVVSEVAGSTSSGSLPVRLARFGVVRGVTRGISSLALVSLTVDVW